MNEPRKKPAVAFWATMIVVVVLVGYPLSIGPVAWISDHLLPAWMTPPIQAAYEPLFWLSGKNEIIEHALERYAGLFLDEKSSWW